MAGEERRRKKRGKGRFQEVSVLREGREGRKKGRKEG